MVVSSVDSPLAPAVEAAGVAADIGEATQAACLVVTMALPFVVVEQHLGAAEHIIDYLLLAMLCLAVS